MSEKKAGHVEQLAEFFERPGVREYVKITAEGVMVGLPIEQPFIFIDNTVKSSEEGVEGRQALA